LVSQAEMLIPGVLGLPALVSVVLATPVMHCRCRCLSVTFLHGPGFFVVLHILPVVVLKSDPVVLQCPFAVWSQNSPYHFVVVPRIVCQCQPLQLAPSTPVGCAPCIHGLCLVGCWIQ
jgi:hypothetical protein